MTINYALYENKLTEAADLYTARVIKTDSANTDDIIDCVVRQGSTLTRPDIMAAIQSIVTAIERMLLDGQRVNFAGLCELVCGIRGNFEGIEDRFDPARHRVNLCVTPGRKMRDIIKANARTAKQAAHLPAPYVSEYNDLASGTTDHFVTSGNIGSVRGTKLAFNPQAEDEGIFFINTGDNQEIKVQAVQKNKPGELIFMVPELADGTYRLQVASRYSAQGQLRAGQLNCLLAAEPAALAVG